MSTVTATYIVDEDVEFLFNQLKQFEPEQQSIFVAHELAKLQTHDAAAMQSPADLVYMRKIWKLVQKKLDEANRPKLDLPVRNVRYSKRFE